MLVYTLFADRQRNILCARQYFHTPVYWLSSWNSDSYFQKTAAFWLGEK